METRKWVLVVATALSIFDSARAGVIFSQDFSSYPTGPTSRYVGAPPNAGQWDTINWNNGTSGGITGGVLSYTRNGTGNGWFARVTDFSPAPQAIIYSFDLEVAGNTVASTTAATWQVGSGFGTGSGAEATTYVHSRFAIDLTSTAGTYKLRDLANGTSSEISGLKTITWVINNSGTALSYLAPDNAQHSLANDSWDLWTDSTRVFTAVAATTPDRPLTDLKFVYGNGYGTIKMDNFSIRTVEAVPELGATGVLAVVFLTVVAFGGTIRARFHTRTLDRGTGPPAQSADPL